eukprot:jgi/Botrbrau1/16931/Bobra.49_2s0001.1
MLSDGLACLCQLFVAFDCPVGAKYSPAISRGSPPGGEVFTLESHSGRAEAQMIGALSLMLHPSSLG